MTQSFAESTRNPRDYSRIRHDFSAKFCTLSSKCLSSAVILGRCRVFEHPLHKFCGPTGETIAMEIEDSMLIQKNLCYRRCAPPSRTYTGGSEFFGRPAGIIASQQQVER